MGSVYKFIELVGTSTESWEKAASAAIEEAAGTLRDTRIVEVTEMDMQLKDGKIATYRTKVRMSYKVESCVDLCLEP
ncbi:MAG: dodecin family protein [Chloroflexota bacterium]